MTATGPTTPAPPGATRTGPWRAKARSSTSSTFRSLHVRNYRLYFLGQLVSVAGTWTETIALALLVLDLSNDSGVAAGTVIGLQFVPTLLFGAFAGVLVDRFDKRRMLIASQAAFGVNALLLAGLVLTDVVQLWMVYVVVLVTGLIRTIDLPLRQAYVSEMVGEADLPNAVALNSATFNVARIVGPAVAALILLASGQNKGICFLVNGLSYGAVLTSALLQRPDELRRAQRAARSPGQVREGIRYVWSIPRLRAMVLLVGVFGTLAMNYNVTLPLIAKVDLGRESAYSAMTVAMGIGSLVGALLAASRHAPSLRLAVSGCLAFGVASMATAAAPGLPLMLVTLALMGFTAITFISTANAFIQLSVVATMRGRVMALYSMVLMGGTPIGSTFMGWVADAASPRASLVVSGVGTIVGGVLLGLQLRPAPSPATTAPATPAAPAATTSTTTPTEELPCDTSSSAAPAYESRPSAWAP